MKEQEFDWTKLGTVCIFLLLATGLHTFTALTIGLNMDFYAMAWFSKIATIAWYTGAVCLGMTVE